MAELAIEPTAAAHAAVGIAIGHRTAFGRTGRILELSLLLFSNLVLFVWAASLKRSGEGLHIPKRPLAPGEPEAIREQLGAFGGILGRAGRIFHNKID